MFNKVSLTTVFQSPQTEKHVKKHEKTRKNNKDIIDDTPNKTSNKYQKCLKLKNQNKTKQRKNRSDTI